MSKCRDCGVLPGTLHQAGCDIERCPKCGGQYFACGCDDSPDSERMPWTGEYPNLEQCREYGFWCKREKIGYSQCTRDTPGAMEDLNRLIIECVWDVSKKKFVQKGH